MGTANGQFTKMARNFVVIRRRIMILIDTQKEEFSKLRNIRILNKAEEENQFYGDFLLIGLGGVGRQCVTSYKRMMQGKIKQEDNVHFLLIDSDIPEMEETIKDSREGVGLNAMEVISIYRQNLENILETGTAEGPVQNTIAKWMRPDFPVMPIGRDGARGNRQIGRLMFSNAYEDMRILLFEKLDEVYNRSKEGKLDVMIISSLCGGTGSGILADITYNIRAYAKSKKWQNFRVGGCLLTPDVLFANSGLDWEKRSVLEANAYATLTEMESLMTLPERGESYVFESGTHRISIKQPIFDSCMLVSGKEDDQGYIPETVIYNDIAYFLYKLTCVKYVSNRREEGAQLLLRDAFFDRAGSRLFKVLNESDYRIPIREIENICEFQVFKEAYKRMHQLNSDNEKMQADRKESFGEIREFLEGGPGEEIHLQANGLLRVASIPRPNYKQIKKGEDYFRTSVPRQLESFKQEVPVIIKYIKNSMMSSLENHIQEYLREYGPFLTVQMIGAKGFENLEADTGMVAEAKALEEMCRTPMEIGEYQRIIDSILHMVQKRFFAFPSAKRETERGYYDASIKQVLETEHKAIREGLNDQDVFGDVIRMLRQRAEQIADTYSRFDQDLWNSVEDLALSGKNVISYMMKNANRSEYLPSDYVTEDKIEDLRKGLIQLMVGHEADIDNGRVVPIRQEMEKIYRNLLVGIGAYAPEKLIAAAFSERPLTLQESNMMFVAPSNKEREDIMHRAAQSFVQGATEKIAKKQLCQLKAEGITFLETQRIISLPQNMPYFSEAVRQILVAEPYNELDDTITLNAGEAEISMEDMYVNVPKEQLQCIDDLKHSYDAIDRATFFGLHTDEVNA